MKVSKVTGYLLCGMILAAGILFFVGDNALAEDVTITTYYPAPYGVYNELQSNKMAVGDTDGSGDLGPGDQPNRDGDIRLKPQSGNPENWSSGEVGQFAYSSMDDALYHYNDSGTWVKQEAVGVCYTVYCSDDVLQISSPMCPATVTIGTQGPCDSGFTVRESLGSWGYCSGTIRGGYFLPPGFSCGGLFHSSIVGRAFVCCQ